MGHARAKLTVFSRQLIVDRVAGGWPAAEVADQLGISRATAHKWLRRFRQEGAALRFEFFNVSRLRLGRFIGYWRCVRKI